MCIHLDMIGAAGNVLPFAEEDDSAIVQDGGDSGTAGGAGSATGSESGSAVGSGSAAGSESEAASGTGSGSSSETGASAGSNAANHPALKPTGKLILKRSYI